MEAEYRSSRSSKLSMVYQSNQLLTPFNQASAYRDIIQYLNKIQESKILPEDFQKRIISLQSDIRGILARQVLVSSPTEPDQNTKYSAILKQKQMEVLQQQLKNKTTKIRIEQMEKDFAIVNEELREFKIRCQQLEFDNQGFNMYRDFFNELSSLFRDRSRKSVTSIQSLMQDKIFPTIDAFEKQLRSFEHSRDKSNLKAHVSQWGRQVNRLSNLQGLNAQILEKSLVGFYKGLENYRSYQILKDQMRWRQQYEVLKRNYDAFASIMKQKIEKLLPQQSSIKELQHIFKNFDFDASKIQFQIVQGFVTSWPRRGEIVQIAHTQQQTHELISYLILQFKHLIEKYPSLNGQLSKKLLEIISYTQIDQLVKTSILDRLHSVISYHSDVITVQNVYKVSMQEERKIALQLRILIKTLLEQIQFLQRETGTKSRLEEQIFKKVKSQILEHAYIDDIKHLYRPLAKTYQVSKFIDRNKFITVETEKPYIIRAQQAVPIQNTREKAVTITQQVEINVQKIKVLTQTIEVPVRIIQEKVVQVPIKYTENTTRLFEKITPQPYKQIQNNYTYEKFVDVAKEVVKEYIYQDKFKEIQIPYQVIHQKLKEVIAREQILQVARQRQQVIKEVPVIVQKLVPIPQYHEVQKRVPYRVTQTVQKIINVEKPVYLNRVQQQILRVPEIVEKIVTRTIVQQKPIQIEVLKQVETVVQIPKQHLVEVTHFIKGDREQIVKQVEVYIEKPIIKEVILPVDKIIQRNIPIYIVQEKPLILQEIHCHIEQQPKIIHLQVPKVVPIIEEIVKEVQVQVPVPVIIQKEIIKQVILQKEVIVEKIVQVPRVVEVEKIVEKIVVVPRIVQVIKEVDRFIEKLVPYQVPILQIVTIHNEKPVIQIKKEIQIVQIQKERIQYLEKPYEVVTEKIVPVTKTIEIMKDVQPEIIHVPVEVIKEYPVQVIRQKLVELIKEIHQVTVKDRQIQIPFRVQVGKELKRDIIVPVVKNIQTLVPVQQIRQRIVEVRTQIPTAIQVILEKEVPIQVIKTIEIEGPETIKYIKQLVEIQVIVQKAVPVYNFIEMPIEIPLKVDVIHPEIHESGIPIDKPYIAEKVSVLQNPTPVHYIHYKEIPVQKQISTPFPYRDIIQVPQKVESIVQKIVQINRTEQVQRQVIREKLVSMIKQVAKVIKSQTPIYETIYKPTEIPGEKQFIITQKYIQVPTQVQRTAEKIVQKIIMLPQIVELTKKIYQLPANVVNAVQRDQKQHYISLATQISQGFLIILDKLKHGSRNVQEKKLVQMITRYQSLLQDWIKLPKIITVKGQQEHHRPTIIPAQDKQKQSVLVHIIEQLLKQLRRLNKKGEKLQLDQQVKQLFFSSLQLDLPSLDQQYHEYYSNLSQKFNSFGQWASDHLLIVNSFLQQKLVFSHEIGNSNLARQELAQRIRDKELQNEEKNKRIKDLQFALDRAFEGIQNQTQIVDVRSRSRLLEDIKRTIFTASDSRYSQQHRTSFKGPKVVQSLIVQEQSRYRMQHSSLVSKLNNLERQKSHLLNRVAQFERQLQLTRGDGKKRTIQNENEYKRVIENLELENRKLRNQIENLKQRDKGRGSCGHERIIENLQNENRRLLQQNARLLEQQQRSSRGSQRGQNINVMLQNTKKNMKQQFDRKIQKIRKDHEQQMKELKAKAPKQQSNLQLQRLARERDQLQIQNIQLRKIIQQSRQAQQEIYRGTKTGTGGRTQQKLYPPSQIQGYKTPKTSFQQKKVEKLPKSSRVEEEQVTQERYMRGDQQIRSTSSRQSRPVTQSSFRSTMTLNMFMQYDPQDIYIKAVMKKIIQGYQEQIKKDQLHTFTPKNIKLLRFHKDKLNQMAVQFQVPNLRKDNRIDGCYLAPEILNGGPLSQKAIVFSLGIIWDELIHHSLYFKTLEQVKNPNIQYQLRSQNFSPIIKNLLVDMLEKDPQKRIGLQEVKKRFLLEQKIKRS